MKKQKSNLIWIDLEMTGLDTQEHDIIEIATIITDSELDIIAEGPSLAIYQRNEALAKMDEWNVRQHTKSGLLARVKASGISLRDAEQQTINFIKQHVLPQTSPMCGNSICQDRRFMARQMPELEAYFHYRNLDVSTMKDLSDRWSNLSNFKKSNNHLALDDTRESIEELRYYKKHYFSSSSVA